MFEMFQYDFMQNALLVGTVVAVVAAAVGYFVVLRGLSFAAHALAHAGFAGAAGAVSCRLLSNSSRSKPRSRNSRKGSRSNSSPNR